MAEDQATGRPNRHRRRLPRRERPAGASDAAAAPSTDAGTPPARGQQERKRARKRRPRREGARGVGRPEKLRPSLSTIEVTVDRGNGFVITKSTDVDPVAHRPVSVRYTLMRDGLPQRLAFARLAEARDAAAKPIEEILPPAAAETGGAPEPEPEPEPDLVPS